VASTSMGPKVSVSMRVLLMVFLGKHWLEVLVWSAEYHFPP
jgi:hypothetical protein